MLGKQAVIEFFQKNKIRNVFHLPGIHTLPLNEALEKQHNIKAFMGRHESGVVSMADGYARASGNIGVVIVTPGPGLGNIVSGCMEAYSDDIPLLIIHIDTERKTSGKGILHELKEPENIFRHFTKKTFAVRDAGNIAQTLAEAYHTALSGRKGPVVVSIPYVLFEKKMPAGHPAASAVNVQRTGATEAMKNRMEISRKMDELEKILHGKKRVLVIGGKSLMLNGIRRTLERICLNASIPFLTTTGGKGILREDSPCSFGNVMKKGVVRDMVASADLVIAVGTRLRDVDSKRRGVKIRELVHIDIDDRWIGKNYSTLLGITGDLKDILAGLSLVLKGKRFEWDLSHLKGLLSDEEASLFKRSSAYAATMLLRETIPEDTTIVCDLNIPSYWAEYYLPVYHQNTFLMPRGISPIFYSLPASIGAKIGRPERPCLALCGDGGVLPAIAELATLKKYDIPVVVFVHNNNSLGILEDAMIDRYGRKGSMALNSPDFVGLARSFGVKAKRTRTLAGLRSILLRDITWDEPCLIEFIQPVSPPPWRV
jgi:acetolactate synthase-1/2/3 large subunit